MTLSPAAEYCIQALQAEGYRAYAVGGCVRDSLLGLTPADYDLCTNARPEEICKVFAGHQLLHHGQKHGTVGVVLDGEVLEITTFRTEGDYQDSRHPGWVAFVPHVEQDLARRDFTVNAMAYDPRTGYVDPFGGQTDLTGKILRAVGDPRQRFREDALRILRGLRFASRFHLTIEPATKTAMEELSPLLDNIARERVFEELCKLLRTVTATELLEYIPILTRVIPELTPMVGFQQHSPHHRYDVFTHTAYVVEAVPGELTLRWAALLHDVGKPACFTMDETGRGHFNGHAKVSSEIADAVLLRLKAPTALRQQVIELIGQHMAPLEADKKFLRRRLGKLGEPMLEKLLHLKEADMGSKGTGKGEDLARLAHIRALLTQIREESSCLTLKDLAVDGKTLQQAGFIPGPNMGRCLNRLLEQVLDEQLPNEKDALLAAAKTIWEELS